MTPVVAGPATGSLLLPSSSDDPTLPRSLGLFGIGFDNSAIFSDGFESGNASSWSLAVL